MQGTCFKCMAQSNFKRGMRTTRVMCVSAQYNKFIMIDRIFFAQNNQMSNPYGHLATEYDVTTNTFRDISSGIVSNSWCSAVRLPLPAGSQLMPVRSGASPST